ncbi:hypothetical protein DFH06DRAFT_1107359 [Mycena polygramma]|nr:hypothetical protein DFH06DRAFT_1107359 [Mycena polygramma]
MHRVLQIPELVEMICSQVPSHFTSDDFGVSGRRDLAALARTAKFFQDPALEYLWSVQDTFAHILRCMPDDLWNEVDPGDSTAMDNLVMIRPIMSADWNRPLFYLHRIKDLYIGGNSQLPPLEILEILALCHPGDPLFPNLRFLDWTDLDHSRFCHIHMFLGPRITTLYIQLPSTVPPLSILPRIALKCPSLTFAEVYYEGVPPFGFREHICSSTSLFVRGLQGIERLRVNDLDASAIEHLGTLSTLNNLTMENLDDTTAISSSRSPHTPRFPALLRLEIYPNTLQVAISCITALSPPALVDLKVVSTHGCTTFSAISALYRSVVVNIPHTLWYLNLDIYHAERLVLLEAYAAKHAALQMLFCFGNLVILSLRIPGGFDLDDAMVLLLARAWPNLRELELVPDEVLPGDRRVTLATLRVFADNCPDLTYLGIELNAHEIPASELDDSEQRTIHTSLTNLLLGHSPIDDTFAVASFLSSIFPRLLVIETRQMYANREPGDHRWAEGTVEYSRRWEAVQETLNQPTEPSS